MQACDEAGEAEKAGQKRQQRARGDRDEGTNGNAHRDHAQRAGQSDGRHRPSHGHPPAVALLQHEQNEDCRDHPWRRRIQNRKQPHRFDDQPLERKNQKDGTRDAEQGGVACDPHR